MPTRPPPASSFSGKDVERANDSVKRKINGQVCEADERKKRGKYGEFTAKDRARIGKYAAENRPTKAGRHFSKLMGCLVMLIDRQIYIRQMSIWYKTANKITAK